jgi:hypothetical protein
MAAFTTEQVRLVDIDQAVQTTLGPVVVHQVLVNALVTAGWDIGRISVRHKPVVVPGGPLYDIIVGNHKMQALVAHGPPVTPDVMVSCDIYPSTVDLNVEALRLHDNNVAPSGVPLPGYPDGGYPGDGVTRPPKTYVWKRKAQ